MGSALQGAECNRGHVAVVHLHEMRAPVARRLAVRPGLLQSARVHRHPSRHLKRSTAIQKASALRERDDDCCAAGRTYLRMALQRRRLGHRSRRLPALPVLCKGGRRLRAASSWRTRSVWRRRLYDASCRRSTTRLADPKDTSRYQAPDVSWTRCSTCRVGI